MSIQAQHSSTERAETFVPLDVLGPWRSIGARLAHVADALPARVAVESASQSYTFAELLGTATAWAGALRHADAGTQPLALAVEPDARTVVAFVAVILSGRPVIPLDPMLPDARARQIVDAAGARRVEVAELEALAPGEAPPATAGPDDPAVIFYTSGSTGVPKGVVHAHDSWLNQAYAARLSLELTTADCNALSLPLSFGGGLDLVFMSLLNGCGMYVHDPRLLGLGGLVERLAVPHITTLHGTPSLWRSLLDLLPEGGGLPGLRVATSCGEAIHSTLVERLRGHLDPDATFVGWSGASEIGTLAHFRVPPGMPVPEGIVPVGEPAANKLVQVLDPDGRPLGPGETGEVAITSRYLALGYHNDPAATARRFRDNGDGTRTYRGGDLGRWDDEGILHLRGRADSAVKVGGYLVEPVEVEAALLANPGVREAVVTAVGERGTRIRLVAHVVPVVAEKAITPAALRRALRERLPSWMVPDAIVLLDALPRNERGKVARTELPAPAAAPPVAPETPSETLLAHIWGDVLGLEQVSAAADFWALGADSLAVADLIARVEEATGITLGSSDLAAAPTVAELARVLDRQHADARAGLPSTAVRLRSGGGRPPVHAFAGGGAPALSLLPVATTLAADVPVHGFQAAGFETRGRVDWTLRSVVRRHLAVIREVTPHGPYVLVGHSYGGLLALETAAALRALGEAVPLVVLLDTILPASVVSRVASAPRPAVDPPPLRERLRMHARLLGAGLVRYPPQAREAVFWEQSLRLVNRHRIAQYPGRTLLFRAQDNPDDPAWWDALLTGPHEVIEIDGGHSSILRPPFNRPIVDRLDRELAALGA